MGFLLIGLGTKYAFNSNVLATIGLGWIIATIIGLGMRTAFKINS